MNANSPIYPMECSVQSLDHNEKRPFNRRRRRPPLGGQNTMFSNSTSASTTMYRPFLVTLVFILLILPHSTLSSDQDPAEQLSRQAVQEYQSRVVQRQRGKVNNNIWEPWSKLADQLLSNGDTNDSTTTTTSATPLQRIGAAEESILTLERAIYAASGGTLPDDRDRDQALAHLYYVYGALLFELSANDCLTLARDPHTLLMGAETVTDASVTHVCRENAENHLRNAVTLDATHTAATTLLEQLLNIQGDSVHQRKPKEFVAELFDSFAASFDEKLVKGLAYQVPTLIGQAAAKHQSMYHAVLDAGCGTGLAGRHLRNLVPSGPLIGVDASDKMLEIADTCTLKRGCGLETTDEFYERSIAEDDPKLYDGLLSMDLEEMTLETTLHTVVSSKPSGFDLVVAADVLVYFGRLDDVLASFAAVSVPGAALIFSCERTSLDEAPLGWRLLPSGRFAHTKEHVMEAAGTVGYVLEDYQEIVPRMEKGEPVQGHMFTFVLRHGTEDGEL